MRQSLLIKHRTAAAVSRMFSLTKWYGDCVTEAGTAAILYWARLRWGRVTIHYGAVLLKPHDGQLVTATTLRPGPAPQPDAHGLHWRCDRIGASGRWEARSRPIRRRLLDGPDGMLDWENLCPRGDVTLRLATGTLSGLGYVERLTVTVPPWRLTIPELRWGRFVSPSESAAWIRWSGPLARSWVFTEHGERPDAAVDDNRVRLCESETLEFGTDVVFRHAPVSHALPRLLRPVAMSIPGWRRAWETKWLARGVVRRPAGATAGWVIHEAVRWP